MIRIVDGSLSRVAGTRSVVISKDLTLKSVLLVPNLACNLLSTSKLTRELKWVTNFFPYILQISAFGIGEDDWQC